MSRSLFVARVVRATCSGAEQASICAVSRIGEMAVDALSNGARRQLVNPELIGLYSALNLGPDHHP
jgi:hypothetical protein